LPSSASSFRTAIAYAERAPPKAPSKTAWQIFVSKARKKLSKKNLLRYGQQA